MARGSTETLVCERCCSEENIEKHHIRQQGDGGSDIDINIQPLCKACHDYKHAFRKIKLDIFYDREAGEVERVKLLQHRLEVLKAFNLPELIKQRGTYRSYWDDPTTHDLPRRIWIVRRAKSLEQFEQLSLWIADSISKGHSNAS